MVKIFPLSRPETRILEGYFTAHGDSVQVKCIDLAVTWRLLEF